MPKKLSTPKPDFVKIGISIPVKLMLQFDRECAERGYTRSEAVRLAMRQLLRVWMGRIT